MIQSTVDSGNLTTKSPAVGNTEFQSVAIRKDVPLKPEQDDDDNNKAGSTSKTPKDSVALAASTEVKRRKTAVDYVGDGWFMKHLQL
jgi:hypothetical protein